MSLVRASPVFLVNPVTTTLPSGVSTMSATRSSEVPGPLCDRCHSRCRWGCTCASTSRTPGSGSGRREAADVGVAGGVDDDLGGLVEPPRRPVVASCPLLGAVGAELDDEEVEVGVEDHTVADVAGGVDVSAAVDGDRQGAAPDTAGGAFVARRPAHGSRPVELDDAEGCAGATDRRSSRRRRRCRRRRSASALAWS